MEISNVEVYGLEESKISSGFPMYTGDPAFLYISEEIDSKVDKRSRLLGNAKSGSGHDCFLKGIVVQFDMKFTQAMHRQILRYHFIDIVSSQSTMHRIKENNFDFHPAVQRTVREELSLLIRLYNENPSKENFERIVYNAPMGLEMWARFTTNYLQLKTIYNQRKNHKLREWRAFCRWCETLPQFMELTQEKRQTEE